MTDAFVTEDEVRTAFSWSEAQYPDDKLTPAIATASEMLERRTGRQFTVEDDAEKTFRPRAQYLSIPDASAVTSVTLDGETLILDDDYWLATDPDRPDVIVGIHFVAHVRRHGVPLEVIVEADWGYDPYPAGLTTAAIHLAAWLAKSPEAVLGGVVQLGEGMAVDISRLPGPAYQFIRDWDRREEQSSAVSMQIEAWG